MLSYGGGHTMKKVVCLVFIILLGTIGFSQQFTRELKLEDKRMNGQDVKLVQEKLLSFGFAEVGEADGWFGPKTEESVKKGQLCFGFTPDGVVRKEFFTALYKTDTLTNALKNAIQCANAIDEKLEHLSTAECQLGIYFGGIFYYNCNKIAKVYAERYEGDGIYSYINLYPFDNGEKLLTYLSKNPYSGASSSSYFLTKDKIYSIEQGRFTEEKITDSLEWYVDILQAGNLDYLLK